MYITIGPRRLPIVVENDLRDDDDRPTYGLFRPAGPDIALDLTTPPTERLGVLVHEIGEAYDHYVGRGDPEHDEGRHNRTAMIMEQLVKNFADQGGEVILHQLFGDETLPDGNIEADGSYASAYEDGAEYPTAVCCPQCKTPYPDRAVRNGIPMFDWKVGGFIMPRWLVCGKCVREYKVHQRCSADGVPWPAVVDVPMMRSLQQG